MNGTQRQKPGQPAGLLLSRTPNCYGVTVCVEWLPCGTRMTAVGWMPVGIWCGLCLFQRTCDWIEPETGDRVTEEVGCVDEAAKRRINGDRDGLRIGAVGFASRLS